ncbi:hypothetical protein PJWF_00099 [Achromobacter phage JWF]|uniref:hypothetical protein n=1 Tax=Achromobacter phage JWF TaxID=1589748 RepID=UPI000588E414|nr:hypothetical protein AXJ13_gp089 [Achromobacter phage JWF]AJD82992.1 hypothetical protein PJWF_00099 [Achromobacter phage JWF]
MSTFKDLAPVIAVRAGILTRLSLAQRSNIPGEEQKVRDELSRFDNTEIEDLIKEHGNG